MGEGPGAPATLSAIAGYRIVRKLSSSDRADIYLGHSDHDPSEPMVAVKLFRPSADPASIEREVSALSGPPIHGLPRLIDVATLPDRRVVLIEERLAGGTLGSLLLTRTSLDAGEAVTILAPVVATLAVLHERDLSHGALGQGCVTFDETGRPVLTGLGDLRTLPSFGVHDATAGPAGLSRFDVIRDDYAKLSILLRCVFARLDGSTPSARRSEYIAAWFEGSISAVPFIPCLDELERRLFDWAPAAPVRLAPDHANTANGTPGRVDPDVTPATADQGDSPLIVRALPEWFRILHIPRDYGAMLTQALEETSLRSRMGEVRAWVGRKRTTLMIAGAIAVAVTAVGLTVLPHDAQTMDPQTDEPQTDGASSPSPAAGTAAHDSVTEHGEGGPASYDAAVVEGDDPVAAAAELLTARYACLAAGSALCVADVDQVDSPLLAADLYAVRRTEGGGKGYRSDEYAHSTAVLIERAGNSALLALTPGQNAAQTKPASLLVIKGEAGWRLREIFEADEDPG